MTEAYLNTITSYDQVLDFSAEDCLDWLTNKVWLDTDWKSGRAPSPILTFEPMSDNEDSTFVLFGEYGKFTKKGTVESAIKWAIWLEVEARMKIEKEAYNV